MLTYDQGTTAYGFVAPAVFSGTMIFVSLMILGMMGINFSLAYISHKMKPKKALILYLISFILMLMMGYLSSKDFSQNLMNWMAEAINIVGWTCFLRATRLLQKAGLETFPLKKISKKACFFFRPEVFVSLQALFVDIKKVELSPYPFRIPSKVKETEQLSEKSLWRRQNSEKVKKKE